MEQLHAGERVLELSDPVGEDRLELEQPLADANPGDNDFWFAFAETVRRMALGFVSAGVIGVVAGSAIGLSRRLQDYVEPTLEFIRPGDASSSLMSS